MSNRFPVTATTKTLLRDVLRLVDGTEDVPLVFVPAGVKPTVTMAEDDGDDNDDEG